MVVALTTTGAIKQRFTLRFLGATIGGLILGLGTIALLFPSMDSMTSLVVLVGAVAFIAGWTSGGPRFNYLGLQIAFAFCLVTLEGFGPSTELLPRAIGWREFFCSACDVVRLRSDLARAHGDCDAPPACLSLPKRGSPSFAA